MTNKERAKMVAENQHANQKYDIYPYMYHVLQVVGIAESLGFDEKIIIACYMHDVLEDGTLSYNDIKQAFGEEVAEIVYAVTDELGRNRKERKEKTYHKIRGNWKAVAVKICDRIANVRQSQLYNPSMFKKYQQEHQDFVKNIWNTEHPQKELEKAWNLLEDLMVTKNY